MSAPEHIPEPHIDPDYDQISPYESCRCGAVRRKGKDWHICKLCATGLPCKKP